MLGGIVEREATSSAPPRPPQPPAQSSAGFPAVLHRSQKPKGTLAFASRRNHQSSKPLQRSASPSQLTPQPFESLHLTEGSAQHAGSSRASQRSGDLDNKRASEFDRVRREVGGANWARIQEMGAEERAEEVMELEERFGERLMRVLKRRAEARVEIEQDKWKGKEAARSHERLSHALRLEEELVGNDDIVDKRDPVTGSGGGNTSGVHTSNGLVQPKKSVRFNAPSLRELKDTYFSSEEAEIDKLAWMTDIPAPLTASTSSSSHFTIRFDLSGVLLSSAEQFDLPTHLGLHNHGRDPDRAGYTLEEILMLCRSTVVGQRITMMQVLVQVIRRYILPDSAGDGDAIQQLRIHWTQEGLGRKVLLLGLNVLAASRNINLLQAGIELVYAVLGGPTWSFMQDLSPSTSFHSDADCAGRAAAVSEVPFNDLRTQLLGLITTADLVPPASVRQLLLVLRRGAWQSIDTAESILPIIPAISQALLFKQPWPPNASNDIRTMVEAVCLLRDIISASRGCAADLLETGIHQSLLRYCVPSTLPSHAAAGYNMATETLRVYTALARYGLGSGLAREGQEIWFSLGTFLRGSPPEVALAATVCRLEEAYFELLARWTTCAIDPHRTTPEHDLTWTQVAAMSWDDEAISAVSRMLPSALDNSEIHQQPASAAILEMLAAWAKGLDVNSPRSGSEERAELSRRLTAVDLDRAVRSILDSRDAADLDEVRTRVMLAAVRLQRALADSHILSAQTLADIRQMVDAATSLPKPSSSVPCLAAELRLGREPECEAMSSAKELMEVLTILQPGEESLCLDLLDELLTTPCAAPGRLVASAALAFTSIGHPDGCLILRPLLQHAILPDASSIVAPAIPVHQYLKASTTLRSPSFGSIPLDGSQKRLTGLPLPRDWLFHPIDELLHSASSTALQQAPPDWNPSETQIVRATLAMVMLAEESGGGLTSSETIFGLMRVYMLEHQTSAAVDVGESEIFRDEAVSQIIQALVRPLTIANPARTNDPLTSLESASRKYLGVEPFFQFYTDLIGLFESSSFGDPTFAQIILPPLSMVYTSDYRKLVWSNPNVLRLIQTPVDEVPLEDAHKGIRVFFEPAETDPEVLSAYGQALVRGWVRERRGILSCIAIHHLGAFFWAGAEASRGNTPSSAASASTGKGDPQAEAMLKLRRGLMQAVFRSASSDFKHSLVTWAKDDGTAVTEDLLQVRHKCIADLV